MRIRVTPQAHQLALGMLSDIHCSLTCTFYCKYVSDVDLNDNLRESDVNNSAVCDRFIWKEEEAHLFLKWGALSFKLSVLKKTHIWTPFNV